MTPFRDVPGMLAPKFPEAMAALAMARAEVQTYFLHTGLVGAGMQLIPILLSVVTTLDIGSGPVYRVISQRIGPKLQNSR